MQGRLAGRLLLWQMINRAVLLPTYDACRTRAHLKTTTASRGTSLSCHQGMAHSWTRTCARKWTQQLRAAAPSNSMTQLSLHPALSKQAQAVSTECVGRRSTAARNGSLTRQQLCITQQPVLAVAPGCVPPVCVPGMLALVPSRCRRCRTWARLHRLRVRTLPT